MNGFRCLRHLITELLNARLLNSRVVTFKGRKKYPKNIVGKWKRSTINITSYLQSEKFNTVDEVVS